MVNIEEITEYFNELFRLGGQKKLVEKQNLLNIFTIGSFGTACFMSILTSLVIHHSFSSLKIFSSFLNCSSLIFDGFPPPFPCCFFNPSFPSSFQIFIHL